MATQDPQRQKALVVPAKSERVYNFHQQTLHALKELLSAAGLTHPEQIGPEHIIRRISSTKVRSLAALHHWVRPDELRDGLVPGHPVFRMFWHMARTDSFAAPPSVLATRTTKLR